MSETLTPLKTCSVCHERKPLVSFSIRSTNKDRHTSYCRACISVAHKRRYAERSQQVKERLRAFNKKLKDDKAEKVFNYLMEHPCVDCDEADPVVLEFDHRDAAIKRWAIAQMIERRFAWEEIMIEIAKCDVRCANCHRRKTSRELGHRRSLLQQRARGGAR